MHFMKKSIILFLATIAFVSCTKKGAAPEENIAFELSSGSAIVNASNSFSFQITLKSKVPDSGVKIEVSAVEELAGTAVTPQPPSLTSTSATISSGVQNLPRQKWVVTSVKVSSVATPSNTATKTFRIVYK